MTNSAERYAVQHAYQLAGHVPVMLAYWDRHRRCRFANPAYEFWLGIEPDTLIGAAMEDVLGPALFVFSEPFVKRALLGEAVTFECPDPDPAGGERHTLVNYTPDIAGGVVAGFFASITDVGALKESEAALHAFIASMATEVDRGQDAAASLFDAQETLAVTLGSIDAGFIAADREGRVTRMNGVAERLLGWAAPDARGKPLWDVFVREDRPVAAALRNPVDVMIEHGIQVSAAHHTVAVVRDGSRAHVEFKAALTHGSDGSVSGMSMVVRDLTPRMRAEMESSRLAAIVESSHDAIIGKSLDGRITSWNAAAQAIFGYRPDEAIGQPVQMLIPPDRQDEARRIVAELARGVHVPAFDTVRRTKDGRLIDLSVTISPVRDSQGRIAGASKIARDISPLRRAEAALRKSEARLRFTLESAQIGDWELDLASLAVNRSLQHDRCFGYVQLQPAWSLHMLLRHVHPDERDAVAAGFHSAVASLADWRTECRVLWPDGSLHWVGLHGRVRNDVSPPRRMLGIITDITLRKQADEARYKADRLEAENRQTQEASRLKSQFLANMSHELRTPLNAIIGFADLLHSGTVRAESPKHATFLGHIATSGRHLLKLINDVLDLSKVESGKFEFFPEPVDLKALVKDITEILNAASERKRISIVTDVDPQLTDLVLDPSRLKQVLYNLLSNAIKFTRDEGLVTVRAFAQGAAHLRIEVEDNGIGIAPSHLPLLFTEFQQLEAGYSRRQEGSGLGLALTRRLVEAQDGQVGVRSQVGSGSVFHIVLNRVHGTDAAARMAAAERPANVGEHHMLVIENDCQIQGRMVQALVRAGFQVQPADSGSQALHLARSKGFDALTLNLRLPESSGLSLLASIRNEGASRASPVVCVNVPTAAGATASFAIENILCKPIRADEVVAAMSRLRLPASRPARVMVIDDERTALDLMHATLGGIGIEAVCLQDGRQALKELALHRPDAIILDLMMPGFDGFAVLDALQDLPEWRATPVFVWTSMILTDEEYAALARSAQAILGKGGGALASMLERLKQWRPAVAAMPPEVR